MSVKSHYYNGVYELRKKSVTADSATTVLDLSDATFFDISIEADTVLQLDNPLKGVYTITVDQTASYNVTFPGKVYFEEGVVPTIPSGPSKSITVELIYDGFNFYACTQPNQSIPFILSMFPDAEAAWSSVVNLNGDPDFKAVRLRRSSDDQEQDFTIKEIHDGTAAAWVNEEVILYQSDFTSGNEDLAELNGIGTDGETVAGVNDAYKFELTGGDVGHFTGRNNFFTGIAPSNAVSISFDYYIPSNNVVVDKLLLTGGGSTNIDSIDTWSQANYSGIPGSQDFRLYAQASLPSTVDADGDVFYLKNIVVTQLTADAHIVTEYDQTGNGNHRSNAVSTQQPLLFEAGVLNTDSGWPCAKLDGSDDNLTGTMPATTGSMLIANSIGADVWEVDIPAGSYSLLPSANATKYPLNPVAQVVWSRTLSDAEKAQVKSWIEKYCTVDFASITTMSRHFAFRGEMVSMPVIDTSNVTNLQNCWDNAGILEVSGLDFRNVVNASVAFQASDIVTYNSSPLDSLTTGIYMFRLTPLQNFPPGIFDNVSGTINLTQAFINTNLTQQSIDNILVSLNTSGTLNGIFAQSGGSAPSAVGEAAIDDLRLKGWTVTVTGGY